jgi:hypothetical protein
MRSTGKPAAATTINSASTPQTAAALNTVNISFGIDMADLLIERDEIVICSKKLLIYSSFKQEQKRWLSHAKRQIGKANGSLGPNNMLAI